MFGLFKKNENADFTGGYVLMPYGYRIFMWTVVLVILVTTAAVWWMAFEFRAVIMAGVWGPAQSFMFIFLGFHIMMMVVSLLGWAMQTFWHTDGVMALFTIALSIGTLSLIFSAWQLWLVFAQIH